MLALGAQVVAVGPQGERVLPIDELLSSPSLPPHCSMTRSSREIRIPIPPPRSGGAYFKLERKVGDFATAARGRAGDAGRRRNLPKSRYRPDQCGRNARSRPARRRNFCAERSWTRPTSRRPGSWRPTKRTAEFGSAWPCGIQERLGEGTDPARARACCTNVPASRDAKAAEESEWRKSKRFKSK